MRVFQNSALYPSYRPRLDSLAATATSFDGRMSSFLADRFGALHFLKPMLERAPEAFFTNGGDVVLQAMWASEHGMPSKSSLQEILIAQIEHHRTEVFYNLDPIKYGSLFVRKITGECKKNAVLAGGAVRKRRSLRVRSGARKLPLHPGELASEGVPGSLFFSGAGPRDEPIRARRSSHRRAFSRHPIRATIRAAPRSSNRSRGWPRTTKLSTASTIPCHQIGGQPARLVPSLTEISSSPGYFEHRQATGIRTIAL